MPEPDVWSACWASAWDPVPGEAIARKADRTPEDPDLADIFSRHQVWTDTLIGKFERALKPMVSRATERTAARLEAALSITEGAIDPTAANDKILAGADSVFMDELNGQGFQKLIEDYTANFSDQLPYLQELLAEIAKQAGRELPPVDFSPADLKVLGRIEAATVGKLDRLFSGAASLAMDRVMFSVAGLPFDQLVSTLAESMGKTLASATTWADTGVSTWYRTASSLQFDEIQADSPNEALKFRYSGPGDQKTRPFCLALLLAGKSYTRDEIDEMSNGQLPNVFVTCGGYSCRHLFVLSLQAAAPVSR